jgi:hypothetical protein
MKKRFFLLALLIPFFAFNTFAQKMGTITVKTHYINIIEGYDHECRTLVYVDGELVAESPVQLQSEPISIKVKVAKGKHDVRIMNQALYEGVWEDHTVANNYSVDAYYDGTINLKKKLSISLVFDIDTETVDTQVK